MADSSAYSQFMVFLNPIDGDMRGAIYDKFFPEKVETRDILTYQYKVIPLVLDLLEQFYTDDAVIEGNAHLFDLIQAFHGSPVIDAEFGYSCLKFLGDFVSLAIDDAILAPDSINSLLQRHLPEVYDIFQLDSDGAPLDSP